MKQLEQNSTKKDLVKMDSTKIGYDKNGYR